jgi:transposase
MRVEVLGGVERRRRWSTEDKLRIVEASLQAGAVVTEVARRNQVSKSLLYEWRRLARMGRLVDEAASFVPVQIEQPASTGSAQVQDAPRSLPAPRRRPSLIEIELAGGRRVRVDAQFDVEALGRVLDLLERR